MACQTAANMNAMSGRRDGRAFTTADFLLFEERPEPRRAPRNLGANLLRSVRRFNKAIAPKGSP